ncbi:hypothetical protein L1987_66689 [Smallanthus sonchifolius]|uniref:Uncharacterized protein n=1 Tax=Smallanthus sonchifolius TaxID=185202 RepID=A0ACB9BXY9_9ASTR|nr:hypothetical protein L1987_66689 [Smallanthus sonchifolius]
MQEESEKRNFVCISNDKGSVLGEEAKVGTSQKRKLESVFPDQAEGCSKWYSNRVYLSSDGYLCDKPLISSLEEKDGDEPPVVDSKNAYKQVGEILRDQLFLTNKIS